MFQLRGTSIPCQMFYHLNCQDQTLSTSCIWILVVVVSWNTTRYLFVKVACEMLTVHRQMDSPEKQSLFWQRMSHSMELVHPFIHKTYAECSTIWSDSACCTPVTARTKHVQSSQRIISQQACEFIIQILYILFLQMAWQQRWCDMSKVRPEYIIRIKIRAKTIFTKFGLWAHNFLSNYPLAYPVQV